MKNNFPFMDSGLPLEERLDDLVERLTLEEKISLVPTLQPEIPRLGIKKYSIGAEGAHGFVDREGNSTTFPQTLGLSSTWDRQLLYEIGKVIGTEARAYYNKGNCGGTSLWFPTIDMEKDPRWGRTEEAYGEDPLLAGELAAQIIKGTQGDHPFYVTATCGPKHFFANNNEKNRGHCSCSVDPRNMFEYYLEPFRIAFKKGKPFSLMTAYNEVNGIPMMQHPAIGDIVKKEWGLEGRGHIVTDGGDMSMTVTEHHYFDLHEQTIEAAFKAGADSMTDLPSIVIPAVRKALEGGLITEQELNHHIKNILRVRFRLGHFDMNGTCPLDAITEDNMMTEQAFALSRRAAQEIAVLLKNEPLDVDGNITKKLLPVLPGEYERIAVVGPLADVVYMDWYTGNPSYKVTPLAAMEESYGKDKILFASGRDVVSLYSEDGFPLVLCSDGTLEKACSMSEKPALFYREDWGWGANTLRSVQTGKYLCTKDDLPTDHQPSAEEIENFKFKGCRGVVSCTAETTLNWFVDTLFNIIPVHSDKVREGMQPIMIRSWRSTGLVSDGQSVVAVATDQPHVFYMKTEVDGISEACVLAQQSDVVIVFAGNNPVINGKEEVDRPSLNLPCKQRQLIDAVHNMNPKTVLVMVSGYPYTIKKESEKIPAILWTAHGIQETGHGIADVLCGAVSPSGKLSMTWYKDESQLPSMMNYDIIATNNTYRYFSGEVLYPFGHGLSYSTFEYGNLVVSSKTLDNSPLQISCDITNTGGCVASEVVQLYAVVRKSRVKRPLKELKGFERVSLEPGETRRIDFVLSADDTAIWDVTRGRFCVEETTCTVQIGSSSEDIRLQTSLKVSGEVIPSRNLFLETQAQNYDEYNGCHLHERRGSPIPAVFNDFDGAWIIFKDCDFGGGAKGFQADIGAMGSAAIEIRTKGVQGSVVAKIDLPNTGDVCAVPGQQRRPLWTRISHPLEISSCITDICIVFHGKVGIQTFRFV